MKYPILLCILLNLNIFNSLFISKKSVAEFSIVAHLEILHFVIKGVHRAGSRGYVELLVAPLAERGQMTTDTVPLLGIEAEELLSAAREADATRADCFGGYRDEPYDRQASTDLILVAEK